MSDRETVIRRIEGAFDAVEHPGDLFLVESREGAEPERVAAAFAGMRDRRAVDPALLDAHHEALSFSSEEAFRFFLPACLVADLRGRLRTADPVFHLTHGFHDVAIAAFTWEETAAIVADLEYRRDADPSGTDHSAIDAALRTCGLAVPTGTGPVNRGL